MTELWGAETRKAIDNFPVSGEPVPITLIHWLGRIKSAAAHVNCDLGLLAPDIAERIATAADQVADGGHDDQFPIDVFQTGSGTSTNMNVNEVVATLAGPDVHPNDHVNLGQSSNDVVPTALHLAALEHTVRTVLPSLHALREALGAKSVEFAELAKAGRTHLMDAVPMTLGQEFSGYEAQIAAGIDRVTATLARVGQVPLGGTAIGTGLNTHVDFAGRVLAHLRTASGLAVSGPSNRFEAQASRDSLVELSGALKVVAVSLTKIANDLALLGSGPRTGLGEINLPELQKGSSIMPGKVNPVMPEMVLQVAAQVIGNDTTITIAGSQGNFELNARVPVIARNLIDSLQLIGSSARLFAERCVAGITANADRLGSHADNTLATATALNPIIGYEAATAIVRQAAASGRSIREVALEHGVAPDVLSRALDPHRFAFPHRDSPGDEPS